MQQLLKQLNEKQQEAVKATEGPVLILAGPGSGKTRTLTHRIAYMIARGVEPQSILAVTFTNKAAGEMKERVASLLAANSKSPASPKTASRGGRILNGEKTISHMPVMGTFHSVCVRILRENAPILGFAKNFVIYDDSDQLSLIKNVMKELSVNPSSLAPRYALAAISRAKDFLRNPEIFEETAVGHPQELIAKIYKEYQSALKQNNAFDFDDLIMQTVELFKHNKQILKKYHERFSHILVDEYQDTNTSQYTLIHLLAAYSRNICVVGDDAQAIYGWRNADFHNILNFRIDWPDARIIKLEQNYRSTPNIIRAASALIRHNQVGYSKKLWTQNPSGENIKVREMRNEYEEAEFIVGEIEKVAQENSYKLNDFVVLYRTNAQSRAIEEAFIREGMPYKIIGGIKFYQRAEIKDIISWLRLVQNPQEAVSLARLEKLNASLLKANLNKKPATSHGAPHVAAKTKKEAIQLLAKDFRARADKKITLTKFIKYIVEKSNFENMLRDGTEKGEERWQNVLELLSVAEGYKTLGLKEASIKFLEDVTLAQEADQINYKSALVHLMTLHMAKGLEFPVVFISGCEKGLLPHASSLMVAAELEEERRLLYVGLTRAKKKAYMLYAQRRMIWGQIQSNPPSSFISEIPEKYLDFELIDGEDEKIIEIN